MNILPRSAWQFTTQPVKGPTVNLARIIRVVLHYTASKRIPADIPQFLRAIQNDYTVNRGYSIGYNFAVDQQGRAWELRGLDIKCAANKGFNEDSLAILLLVDDQSPANPAMLATARQLIAHIRAHAPNAKAIVPHGDLMPTGCPGAGVKAQIKAGQFEPAQPTPEPEDPDMAKVFKTISVSAPGRGGAMVTIHMKGYNTPDEKAAQEKFDDAEVRTVDTATFDLLAELAT